MAYFHTTVLDDLIKALPTVSTASGSIATFDTDMTENLIDVECDIQYSQAEGTPSPSNPLLIKIYNSLNLAHIGNTDKLTYLQGLLNGTYGFVDLSSLSWSYQTSGERFVSAGIASLVKAPASNNDIANVACSILTTTYANNTTAGGLDNSIAITSTSKNIVVKATSAGTTQAGIVAYLSGCGFIYELATPATPTITMAEFNALLTAFGIDGSLYNVSFGQTVAKGKFNLTTGVLDITHGIKIFTGASGENWNKHESIASWFYIDNQIDGYMNGAESDFQFCNVGEQTKYDYVTSLANGHFAYGSSNKRFVFKNTDYTETADFKTWLSNNNMQVVYRLPSPLTVQLDSKTITALLNENNIWCDTNGNTSVKYILSVGKAIS